MPLLRRRRARSFTQREKLGLPQVRAHRRNAEVPEAGPKGQRMSARKNPDLCQRPHCRESWAYLVTGRDPRSYFGGRTWKLRVCSRHVEEYGSGSYTDAVGRRITVTSRQDGAGGSSKTKTRPAVF